ncbi:hypothetical protein F5Y15DRAFT_52642 [Xylariaceae sp. FL0016]|nr:hypothetical protein F5Y15DRAFT_52642 [Xylariaceae sp. FL0016]
MSSLPSQQPNGILLSPWAKRFGRHGTSLFESDLVKHSGLAPDFPTLPPVEFDQPPQTVAQALNNQELDRLFYGESVQFTRLRGLRSYEVAPLNRIVGFSGGNEILGGHQPGAFDDENSYKEQWQTYIRLRADVNEGEWFGFLRKGRWMDSAVSGSLVLGRQGSNPPPRQISFARWSVDVPEIWEELGFSLEIADRILKALVEEKNEWLGTMLFGRISLWKDWEAVPQGARRPHHRPDQEPRVILSPRIESQRCQEKDIPYQGVSDAEYNSKEKWIAAIEDLLLAHKWGFLAGIDDNPYGRTYHVGGQLEYRTITVATISHRYFLSLCSKDLTVAERSSLSYHLTITILHELMHALMLARLASSKLRSPDVKLKPNGINPPYDEREAYVNFEAICEVGRSFENTLLGGHLWRTRPQPIRASSNGLNSLNMGGVTYPSDMAMSRNLGAIRDRFVANMDVRHVPAMYAWERQSKGFWDNGPRTSTDFILPRVLTTDAVSDALQGRTQYNDDITIAEDADSGPYAPVIQAWQERQTQFHTARDIFQYPSARKTWLQSPWSFISGRIAIERFQDAVDADSERDYSRHLNTLENFLPRVNIQESQYTDETYLPTAERDSHHWLYHSMFLLMSAAVPLLRTEDARTQIITRLPAVRFIDRGNPRQGYYLSPPRESKSTFVIKKRNVFYNRLTGAQQQVQSLVDYLDAFCDLAMFMMKTRGCRVSRSWFQAMSSAEVNLRNFRSNPGNSDSVMAPWSFMIPEYLPSDTITWNDVAWMH